MHPLSQPWAISEDGLQLVLAVWSRGNLFSDRLSQARTDHGDQPMVNDTGKMLVEGGVAVIPIAGPLMRHADMFTDISGATSYGRIRRDLVHAVASEDVRSIVLRIDSPGGEAFGVGELADQIRSAHARKPVTAYVEGSGCSAAYWLASAAGEIVCAPTAMLGSIGTRIALIDSTGAQEKAGIKRVEVVSSQSPSKRGTPVDDEVIARAQQVADDMTDVFLASVARFRSTTPARVERDFGGGDVMVGARAVKAGLADRLGSFDSVLADARARTSRAAAQGASMKTETPAQLGQETELVPTAELLAAQARVRDLEQQQAASAPLLAQVAKLTGKATIGEQQVALAQLGVKAAQTDSLQAQLGDERTILMDKARAKKIPPVAMGGWEDFSIETLREVVEKTKGLRNFTPAETAKGSDPAETETAIALTDTDRAYARDRGISEEDMLNRKRAGIEAMAAQGRA